MSVTKHLILKKEKILSPLLPSSPGQFPGHPRSRETWNEANERPSYFNFISNELAHIVAMVMMVQPDQTKWTCADLSWCGFKRSVAKNKLFYHIHIYVVWSGPRPEQTGSRSLVYPPSFTSPPFLPSRNVPQQHAQAVWSHVANGSWTQCLQPNVTVLDALLFKYVEQKGKSST